MYREAFFYKAVDVTQVDTSYFFGTLRPKMLLNFHFEIHELCFLNCSATGIVQLGFTEAVQYMSMHAETMK